MQISGMPNKFEIFQEFYYVQNGVEISYREALRLFYEMDNDTRNSFEQYYKDEVGYEVVLDAEGNPIDIDPFTTPNGYNLDRKNGSSAAKGAINIKYTLDAYAKKNGLVLDEQWAIYSAEEIIAMADGGVNVPQEVIDIANTILQTQAATEIASEGEDTEEEPEKDSFINLIPKAQKKIKKCNENNEKIEDKVEDLLPQQNKRNKKLADKMKEQKRSLKEFEEFVKEWNKIQTKINNGEPLTTSEAKRYAQLTGMFEDKKSGSDKNEFSIDKREIAKSMNELNILSILGEQLAEETIEIGDALADYTSKANYKATRREVMGQTGFLQALCLMATGKALAKEAVVAGNESKEYTEETQNSVNDIALTLDIKDQVAGKDEILGQQAQEIKPEQPGSEDAVENAEEQPAQETQSAQGEEKNPEVTEQEDFVINDKNVIGLIKEAADINVDLAKQTVSAVKSIKVAKDDRKFAKIAGIKVTKLVKEFQQKEEERQARIQEMEQENKEANQELENLTGKSSEELNKEQPTEKTEKGDKEQSADKTDSQKVAELRQKVAANNEEIATLKSESEDAKGEFKNATVKESEIISQAIPAETEALKKDTKYKEEVIPVAKERLDFTDASGETLSKIGMYRVELGMMQIMLWQFTKGLKNIALGTISTGIGVAAQAVGDTPLATIAEKATDKATKEEDTAINDLTTLEGEIISVTGEDATVIPADEEENAEEGVEGAENGEETTSAEGAEGGTEPTVVEEEVVTDAQEQVEDTGLETSVVEEPSTEKPAEETPAVPAEENTNDVVEETEGEENTEGTEGADKKEKKEKSPEALAKDADKQEDQMKKQTDKQEDVVKNGARTAKDAGKESKKIEKDEKKDAKQLEKEAKNLEKQIKKEEEEVIALTEESQKAVEKQAEILMEYETLTAESEQMMAEEEAKQMSAPKQPAPQGKDGEQGGLLASNSFTITNTGAVDNSSKLAQNDMRINELSVEFQGQDRIVVRNRAKITTIQDSIKNKSVKFEKKLKLKDKKIKETEKKEKEKQKKLNKIFGAIGIAENIFSITSTTGLVLIQIGTPMEASGTALITAGTIQISIGTPLLSNPFTAAAGAALVSAGTVQVTTGTSLETSGITLQSVGSVLKIIGLVGSAACGVTKAVINIANGNLTAGLIALGATAVSVATSFAGGGAAAGSALNYVSEGLSIVSSSAELVNNVRAVQGKEANGVMSKISTIAGVGSAVTGAANSIGNMGGQNTIGKIATITSAAGTALSSTSQIMSEFGAEGKASEILGMVGGGLQTLGSIGQLANKNNKTENNDDKKEETNVDDEVNKTIDNDNNLTPEQKTQAKQAVDKLKNDPKLKQEVAGKRDAIIDQELSKMGMSDKQKAQVKQKLQQSGNYSKPEEKQQLQNPKNKTEKTEKQEQPKEQKSAPTDVVPENKEPKTPVSEPVEKENTDKIKVAGMSEDETTVAAEALRSENPADTSSSQNIETNEEDAQQPQKIKKLEPLKVDPKDAVLDVAVIDPNDPKVKADMDASVKALKEKTNQPKNNKLSKSEKLNQILDITGQVANTGAQVAGMFMSQKEGETKKKAAAPGRLTERTKEIMRKNELYRRRKVQALAKAQRYYA